MQIASVGSSVTVSGISTGKFRGEFNPKIVKMLSDTLYSNKPRSIMRELGCNAYDSHVANGNSEQPFYIHLPTDKECYFSIRDYGTGLSEEKIIDIYTVYGASDKSDSNDYIGCLGIGSKSPFCYNTKTYNVKSYYNGKMYHYSFFLDAEHMPSYVKMTEEDTTEQNGVYIEIPVAKADISRFSDELDVYSYFATKPQLNFGIVPSVKYLKTTDLYSYRDGYGHSVAIMGGVVYPIDYNNSTWTQQQKDILRYPIDLFFDIGKLDVGNGRESLSYDNLTINRIKARLDNIVSSVTISVNNDISKCDSLWDARCYISDITGLEIFLIDRKQLKWNNQNIYNGYSLQFDIPKSEYHSSGSRPKKTYSISCSSKLKFYEFDLKTGNYVRLKSLSRALVVTPENKDDLKNVLGITDKHIQKTSSIPHTVNPRTYKRVSTKTTSCMLWTGYFYRKTYCWKNIEVDKSVGGYYIPWKSYSAEKIGNLGLEAVISNINIITGSTVTVYGIKEKYIKKLGPNWINIFDYALSLCKEDPKEVEEKHDKYHLYKNFITNYEDFKPFIEHSHFEKILEGSKISEKYVALHQLQCYITGTSPKVPANTSVEVLIKEFCKKYPLAYKFYEDYYHETELNSAILSVLKEQLCLPQS